MFDQERGNLLVHDRNLIRLGEYRELRREREGERQRVEKRKGVAISEDAEDGLGGANRSPGVQKQCQASAHDGINLRGHKQLLYLEVVAKEGDDEEEVEDLSVTSSHRPSP